MSRQTTTPHPPVAGLTGPKARAARYRAAHREEIRAKDRARSAANRRKHSDRVRSSNACWREVHRAEIAANDRAYRAAHRDEIAARQAASRATQRAEIAARTAARKFGEHVPLDEWRPIWSGPCFGCGKTPAEGVDHVVPRSKGGRNVVENLQPACLRCNLRKGARAPNVEIRLDRAS